MAKTVAELRKERDRGKYNVSGNSSVKKTKTVAELRKERDSGKFNIIIDKSVKKSQDYQEQVKQRKIQKVAQPEDFKSYVAAIPYKWKGAVTPADVINQKAKQRAEKLAPLKTALKGLPEKPLYSDINTRKTELENLRGGAKRRGIDTKDYEAQIDALNTYMSHNRDVIDTMTEDDVRSVIGESIDIEKNFTDDERKMYQWLASFNNGDIMAQSDEEHNKNKDTAVQYGKYFENTYGIKPDTVTLETTANHQTKTNEGSIAYYDETGKAVTWQEALIIKHQENKFHDLQADPSLHDEYEGLSQLYSDFSVLQDVLGSSDGETYDEEKINEVFDKYGINSEEPIEYKLTKLSKILQDDIASKKKTLIDNGYNWDELQKYTEYLSDKEAYEKQKAKNEGFASKHPVLATGASILSSPSQIADLGENAMDAIASIGRDDTSAYKLTNPYDDVNVNRINTQNATVTNLIDKKVYDMTDSETLSWLASTAYSGGTSAAQSALTGTVSTLLFGPKAGPSVALGLLSSQSASAGFNKTAMNGGTYGEAMTTALADGVAEAMFEKLSLDSFINLKSGLDTSTFRGLMNSTLRNSKNVLVHSMIEGSEELMTECATSVADEIINGDHSDYAISVDKYMQVGLSEEEAKRKASADSVKQVLQATIGGFIGGFGTGGAKVVANTVVGGADLAETSHKNKAVGNQIASQGNAEVAINKALNLPDTSSNTKIKKLAQEIQNTDTSKLSKPQVSKYNKKLGQLYDMLQTSSVSDVINSSDVAIKDVIKQKLTEYGVTEHTDDIASAIYKQFKGQETNYIDRGLIKANYGDEIITYLNDNKSEVEETVASRISESYRNFDSVKGLLGIEEISDIDIEDFNLSDDGKTYIAGTSNAVKVGKIEKISKDDIVVSLSNGSEESVKNLDLGSSEQAVLYQGVLDIQSDLGVKLDTSTANALVTAYNNLGVDAKTYVMDAKVAIMKGYANVGANTLKTNVLGNKARIIYDLGVRLSENEISRRKKTVTNKVAPKTKSSVAFEDVDRNNLTERQRISVSAVEKLSESTGVNFVFFSSEKKNGKYTSKYDTEKGSPNGFYKASTNTVYLDINAGATGKGTILFTAAHELTHAIREWSPESFKTFADFLAEKYTAKGENFDALIRSKMQQLDLTYDEAYEEVVADSCESFLIDSNLIENVEELSKRDMNLATKIKDFLKNLLQKVREVYKKLSPDSYEGKYVREMRDSLSELHGKWIQGIKNATENLNNAKTGTTKDTAKNDGVKFSFAGREAVNSDISLLQKAQSMIENGIDSETVRKETGWFRGYDGKWRFEIDDSEFEFHFGGLNKNPDVLRFKHLQNKFIHGSISDTEVKEMNTLKEALKGVNIKLKTISDRVVHNKLFKAYPQLKDIKLVFDTLDKNTKGKYSYQNKTITLNNKLIGDNEQIRKTLIHEMQHAIQDIEGFTAGASVEYWKNQRKEINELIGGARANLDLWLDDIGYNEFVKKSMQEVVKKEKTLEQHWEDCRRLKENSKFAKQIANCEAEIAEYERQRKEITKGMNVVDQYFNTAGEIEARDTENRLNLSEKQRKNTRPDIDRTSVAFAYGDVSSSIEYTTQNEPVVVVKDDILSGISKNDWVKTAKSIIKAKFSNGIPVKGRLIKVNQKSRQEFTNSKYSKYLRDNNSVMYEDKLKSSGNLDEIVLASTNYINEDLKHVRNDSFVEFARGDVLMRIGDNDYSAKVIVGFTKKAEMVLYDVIELNTTSFDIKKESTPNSSRTVRSGVPSNSIIPQGDNTVNNNSTQKDSKNSLRDKTYLEAVKNGDMETAQRMVDEYAEEVFANSKIRDEDGKLLKVYHGTDADFNVFDKTKGRSSMDIQGMFFSPWDIDARGYGPNVRAFYLNITNPANESTGYRYLHKYRGQYYAGTKAREDLERMGYDGVNNENEEFIAFNSEQIKSADPVTYDDNGDVIPLSKRFDFENEDIRYQARPDFSDILFDEFDGEVTDNDARLITEYIDGNADTISHILDKTKSITLSESKVKSLVSRMLSSYDLSKDNQKAVYVATLSLLESTDRREVLDNLELIKTALTNTIQSSTLISEYDKSQKADVLEYLRDFRKEYSVYLNDEQLSSLEFQGRSVSWLKKELFPLVSIVKEDSDSSKKKMSFGYFWHNISEVFPDIFDMDHTDSVDNWEIFLEKLNRIKNPPALTVEDAFGISEGELVNELTGRLVADAVEAKYNSTKNAYVAKLVEDLRKSHNFKIAKNNAKIKEQVKTKERERYEKVGLRAKIRRMASVNERRLTNPNKSNFIPRSLVAQAVDVMNSLNLDSGRSQRLSEKIAKLKASYNMLKEDAKHMAAYDDVVADMLDVFLIEVGDTNITKMSLHQLQVAYKTLRALETAVNASAKMIDSNIKKDIYTLGRELISETRGVSKTHDSLFYKYINTQMRPETFFESLADFKKDSSWSSLYDMLNEGQLKSTRINMEFTRTFDELLTDTSNLKTLSDTKKLVDIGLTDNDGNKVFITRGMMLGLYMHLGNVDNANHIARGGLTVPGLDEYYKGDYTKAFGSKQTSARAFSSKLSRMNRRVNDLNRKLEDQSLTEDERKSLNNELSGVLDEFNELSELEYANGLRGNIEKLLTEYEKKWIKTAHYFFDTQTKSEINNVSNLLYGFEKATVENYYPIHTDSSYRVASFENIVRDFALENVGFMKNRIKGASTPILLEDITDVISNYISSVSKYCGMTIPIKNFQKVYGVSTAGFDTSVQKELQLKFSDNATKYIDNLITDLTTSRSTKDLFSKSLSEVRGNLAKAVLSVNLRVAIAQAASYPTAAAEIGWEPLLKAFVKGGKNSTIISRADKELIAKWSPLLWYRMQGYSTTEIGDIKSERNKQVVVEKKLRWFLGWIQAVDGATVGRLWYASEYYVQKNSPKLKKGTDGYYEEVAKVFNRVVERTQPNYTTLQRPDILRNPNAVLKSLTMFMTQRAQNYNIMYSASAKYLKYRNDFRNSKNGVTIEDVKEAKVSFQRAVSSQITATVTLVAMKALSDVIMHSFAAYTDDDDELTPESVSSKLIDMFIDTLVGNIAFGTETYSFAKIMCNKIFGDGNDYYYGVSLNGVESLFEVFDSIVNVADEFSLDSANDLAVSVCQVLGQPLGNVEKIATGLYNWYLDIANGEFIYNNSGSKNKESKEVSKFRRKYESGDTYRASLIVDELTQKEYNKFYNKGYTEEEAEKKANSEVRAKFTRAYKDVYLQEFFEGDSSKAADIRRMMYSTGLYGSLSDFDKTIAGWKKDYNEDLEIQKRAKERTK